MVQSIELRLQFGAGDVSAVGTLLTRLQEIIGSPPTPELAPTPHADDAAVDEIVREWGESDLKLLNRDLARNPVALNVLDDAAVNFGRPVTFVDACSKAGLSGAAGRGQFQALGKLSKRMKKRTWPVMVLWAADGVAHMCYVMPARVAASWRAIRGL